HRTNRIDSYSIDGKLIRQPSCFPLRTAIYALKNCPFTESLFQRRFSDREVVRAGIARDESIPVTIYRNAMCGIIGIPADICRINQRAGWRELCHNCIGAVSAVRSLKSAGGSWEIF